jgi:hypothetical protein
MHKLTRNVAIIVLLLLAGIACGQPGVTAAQAPALGGCQILPADNVWNTPIDKLPLDTHSLEYVKNIGLNAPLHADFGSGQYGDYGIPYNIVLQGEAKVPVSFEYADESDPGPYPIPKNPKIEGGSDRHILVLEQGVCRLYETWASSPDGNGGWNAGSGAIFNLSANTVRTDTWTSADAAGLPILPGLTRYDEVAAGAINHALRFTAPCTADHHIWPARHTAVPDSCPATPPAGTRVPPMGLRFRLKAGVNIGAFSHDAQVMLTALKKYGMIVADNGSSWYLSGAPDPRWNDDRLVQDFNQIHGSDFEAVDETALQISANSGQARQPAQESMSVTPGGARQGQTATYTIQIGGDGTPISLSNQLPSSVTLVAGPATMPGSVPAAVYDSATRILSWSAAPASTIFVAISYSVSIDTATIGPIVNTATVTRAGGPLQLSAMLIANPLQRFLALVRR